MARQLSNKVEHCPRCRKLKSKVGPCKSCGYIASIDDQKSFTINGLDATKLTSVKINGVIFIRK